MKTRTLVISILLLAIVLTPLAMGAKTRNSRGPGDNNRRGGFGGGPGTMMQMKGGMGGDWLMRQLDLTDKQQAEIKAIREESQPQIQQAREAVQKANQALQETIENGTDDQIMAAAKQLGKAIGKAGVLRAQTERKINKVLTPEQRDEMKELKNKMRERMHRWMQQKDRPDDAPAAYQKGKKAEKRDRPDEDKGRQRRRR